MIKHALSMALLLCCCGSVSAAMTSGFYFGGGAGASYASVEQGDYCYYYDYYDDCDGYDYDSGEEDTAFTAHAGYRIGPYFAMEVMYLNSGTPEWDEGFVYVPEFDDVFDNFVELNLEAAQLSIVGILPFAGSWEVYARGGVSYWWADADQLLIRTIDGEPVARRVDDEDADFLIGIGGGFSITPEWHVRAEFQSFGIEDELLNVDNDSTLDSFFVELQFRPGWQ